MSLLDSVIAFCSALTPFDSHAWHVFGIGIGQSEIIGSGLVVATTGIVGFRRFTRGKRYFS